LYDGDKEFAIKKSKIRGVESFGMICAEDEIGVGTSHDGIIVIADDVKPGTPAAEFYGLTSDYVLEVDLTPNRIDAASHYGVARDLAAWMSAHTEAGNLHRPEVGAFAIDTPEGGITVDVENTDACPRYTGVTVRGVTVKESPKWLKDALSTIGLRPINNIVDITNYLLHGMGQPLHCFDVAKIAGNKIVVKNAKEGEKFVTLDGVEHTLDSRDLMICNTEVPMCIAGVFGGLDSGVTEATTDVFLESAYFNPTSVRKTARRHGLNTDSSFRFERGVDPNNTLYVLKLAALMVKELAGGEICGPLCDNYPSRIEPAEVSLSFEYFDKLIGKHIPADTIVSILNSLEMELTEVTDEKADMKVPTYRVDVTRPCDVAEDVLRIYGYNNVEISSSVRSALSSQSFEDQDNKLRNLISEQLTAEGFNEILNNSLTAEAYYTDLAAYPADHCVRLLNPLSNDLNVMRQTLLFGGLESLSHNINRKMADLAMYEFGNVYFFNPAVEATAEKVLAPYSEASRLAIWLTGALRPGNWARPEQPATVYDMKAVIANVLNRLGINPAEIKLAASSCALYSAALDINTRSGKNLGTLGVISKKLASKFDIKQEVIYCELDWHALVNLSLRKKVSYLPLAKTMPVKRDLALLLDKNVTLDQVEAIVRESERRLLRSVTLFDVYEGKNLPEGKKSYAIAITLQDDEKTLQDKQIEAVMNKVIGNLTKKLGAELR
ncbi:MAG TPA: phenylalanine--tRNA ligase subunit beta, partial [Porphyromonadaceae bacterium]|nr:phenylalanine--tRNA ligase subunit beta [Porphyromonadaceae bacterium]